ncbi:hypothetical protein [Enterococcus sp. DIV1420a]|uniref:hypothetical protein n=1 Tax=Enterococcus sp. DIV1420a TaxID=2774672 RepID=UPI0036D5C141
MKKLTGLLVTTALLGGVVLSTVPVWAADSGTSTIDVQYTTAVQVNDPANPDSPSYAIQLPSGFNFTKLNEPANGVAEGTGINGNFKMVNPDGVNDYSGAKNVKLSVASAKNWTLKDTADNVGSTYKLKDGAIDATAANYSFTLNSTTNTKTLTATLTGKANQSGNYSDVLTFTYENVTS